MQWKKQPQNLYYCTFQQQRFLSVMMNKKYLYFWPQTITGIYMCKTTMHMTWVFSSLQWFYHQRLAKINRNGFRGTCCSEHNHFPKGGDEKFICSGVSMSLRVIFCYKADMDVLNLHKSGRVGLSPLHGLNLQPVKEIRSLNHFDTISVTDPGKLPSEVQFNIFSNYVFQPVNYFSGVQSSSKSLKLKIFKGLNPLTPFSLPIVAKFLLPHPFTTDGHSR